MCTAVLHCVYAYVHNHQPMYLVCRLCMAYSHVLSLLVCYPPQCIGVAITYELVGRPVEPITVCQVVVALQTELQICLGAQPLVVMAAAQGGDAVISITWLPWERHMLVSCCKHYRHTCFGELGD